MRAVKRLLWWMLASSAGGINRARILQELIIMPRNANELATIIELDYKTTRHHLKVLEKNKLVISTGSNYGKIFFPSNLIEENIDIFNEICCKIGKKKINNKGLIGGEE